MIHRLLLSLAMLLISGPGARLWAPPTPTPGRAAAPGRVFEIYPSNADASCNEEFENLANSLGPGDELVLHGGSYSQACRRAITVQGTASRPVVIRAADGEIPILTRPRPASYSYSQNNIEIVDSAYLVVRGLHFRGGDIGVRFIRGHHITMEDNEVYETGNNAIAMNSGDTDAFILRGNHIHHTGLLDLSVGTTEGEGMYVGCNQAACVASNHLILGNYIHDLRGTSGGGNDGIEVKVGSYGNVLRDNVIHDTTLGTRYPCIFVYGGGPAPNIVEGNALWNCGEAIQVVSDAVVRNNLILNSDVGITTAPHAQVPLMRSVTIVNNTLYGHGQCLYLRWAGAVGMVLANNAIYCPGATAVNASGLTGAGAVVQANYLEGGLAGVSLDNNRFFNGGHAPAVFTDPGGLDFWPRPGAPLVAAAAPAYAPLEDFNGLPRQSPFDVGAYETDGQASNQGWPPAPGFKGAVSPSLPPRVFFPQLWRAP